MISEAKTDYETRLALNYAHTNSNKIFQYISSIKGRENFPVNMTYNDDYTSSDSDKAQLFNNYFYSVSSVSDNMPTTESDLQPCSPTLHDIHFSDSDVLNLLTNLDVSKASGIDN